MKLPTHFADILDSFSLEKLIHGLGSPERYEAGRTSLCLILDLDLDLEKSTY